MPPRSLLQMDSPSRVQLLSNGHYTVMLNAAGSGYSQWHGLAVTRWREDPVGDGWGSYLLLRDEESGDIWSPTPQPYGTTGDNYAASLCDDHVSMTSHHGSLATKLEVAVAGDRDLEWRRITLTNEGSRERTISLTSYAELVLAQGSADAAHPAFSKMFVQTEWAEQENALLATRRRRSSSEPEIWAAHRVMVESDPDGGCDYETDRMRFLGRGHTLRHAQAMQKGAELSKSCGCVLDPIFSLRRRVRIAPGSSVQVVFLTALAPSRSDVLTLIQSVNKQGAGGDILASAKAHADAQPRRCFMLMRHSGLRVNSLHSALAVLPFYGAAAFPAIGRSCCCASPMPRIWRVCMSCSCPSLTGRPSN
jgi:cellobiose phosphorylase